MSQQSYRRLRGSSSGSLIITLSLIAWLDHFARIEKGNDLEVFPSPTTQCYPQKIQRGEDSLHGFEEAYPAFPTPSRFRGPPNSQSRKRDNQKPQHGLSHDPGCFGATKETISVNDDQHGKKDHQPQQKQHTCKTGPFR